MTFERCRHFVRRRRAVITECPMLHHRHVPRYAPAQLLFDGRYRQASTTGLPLRINRHQYHHTISHHVAQMPRQSGHLVNRLYAAATEEPVARNAPPIRSPADVVQARYFPPSPTPASFHVITPGGVLPPRQYNHITTAHAWHTTARMLHQANMDRASTPPPPAR